MNHSLRERVKSVIIILLLGCSLIQVGILWGEQSHGFPFNLLDKIFRRPVLQVTDQMIRDDLFVPYKLVVSNGEEAHWILGRESQYYNLLWTEAKYYLNEIALGNLKTAIDDKNDWGDITTRRGFLIEFRYTIKPSLLSWFLGKSANSSNTPSVTKMMIVPDSSDESTGIVYIYNPETNYLEYKYYGINRKESFDKILTVIKDSNLYREYISMRDINFDNRNNEVKVDGGSQAGIDPDVLYLSSSEGSQPYNIVSCSIPQSIDRPNELEDVILGKNKDRYTPGIGNGYIQLSDTNNKYKIFNNGLLEYDYLSQDGPSVNSDGGVGKALWNSYEFINRIEALTNKKVEIQLSGMSENKDGSFNFSFDYFINQVPVYVDIKSGSNSITDSHVIVIGADSKRILKCRWLIRNLTTNGKGSYNDRFFEVVNRPGVGSYKKIKIKDLAVGYVIDSLEDKSLEPVMVIDSGTGILSINMPKEKGG